jgi:hypothetical protein
MAYVGEDGLPLGTEPDFMLWHLPEGAELIAACRESGVKVAGYGWVRVIDGIMTPLVSCLRPSDVSWLRSHGLSA